MAKLEYKEIQQVLNTLEIDDLEEEPSQGSTNIEFTAEEAVSILKQAVSAYYVSTTLQKMSKTADFNSRNIRPSTKNSRWRFVYNRAITCLIGVPENYIHDVNYIHNLL